MNYVFLGISARLMLALVISVSMVFPAVAAEGTEEVLLGVGLTSEGLQFTVASGGCTQKSDFAVEVNKGITAKLPYLVTVRRMKPDNCKAMIEGGTVIRFTKKELELSGIVEVTLTNKIGNTSQHR